MKKFFFLVLIICFTFPVWCQDKPAKTGGAGLGLIYSTDFSGNMEVSGPITESFPVIFNNIGIFAYGDFVYVELIGALFYGLDSKRYLNFLGSDLGIYGKFPFVLSPAINLFPMLGFEFQAALFGFFSSSHFEKRHFVWRQFWFKGGAGLDYKINERIHLRFEALYGIRLKSGSDNTTLNGLNLILNDSIGHGLTIRIGIGV